MKRKFWLKVLLLITAVFLAVGCQPTGADEPKATPKPEKPRYNGPKPEKGMGSMFGRLTWNGAAAANLDLILCPDFNTFSGCRGENYTAVTENDGTFLFANIKPGTYALSVRVHNDQWLTIGGGILSSADFVVEADETLIIETQPIYKLNMEIQKPGNNAIVKSGSTTFNWEDYPDADYYLIYLTPDKGEPLYVNEKVEEAKIVVGIPPLNCDYRWRIEAFNNDGIKIAELADFAEFRVAGESASCILKINEPVDDSTIPAHDIILQWEPHPMADKYKILMWDDDDPDQTKMLDFVTVTESQFEFNGALKPDHRYVWSVHAYNENGQKVAASEIVDFVVRP